MSSRTLSIETPSARGSPPAGGSFFALPCDGPTATVIPTPLGPVLAMAKGGILVLAAFQDEADSAADIFGGERPTKEPSVPEADAALLRSLAERLDAYFRGERVRFDLPLAPEDTPFRVRVREALLSVPYGATISYAELAQRVGLDRRGARAAGQAVGANRYAILVPCHRVLASNGGTGGYRWGQRRKTALLALESGLTR